MFTSIFIILAVLFVKHWYIDFVNQTSEEVAGKGIYGQAHGVMHSIKHGVATAILMFMFMRDFEFVVTDADTDEFVLCGKGINLATMDWVIKNHESGYRILIAEFESKDIASIPVASDGKFRVFRCEIVGEKKLIDVGIKP